MKISCDICMDLMPLVKDGVASEDSRLSVMEHTASCERCAAAFGNGTEQTAPMDDAAVLGKIKKRLALILLTGILAGALIGLALSDGMGMFYNALIMPAIGALGYRLLKKKAYCVPLGLFLFSFLWVAIREIGKGFLLYGTIAELTVMSAWWGGIFGVFSAVGVLIAALLSYAFRKEGAV